MSLDKAIKHGKEHRRRYYGAAAVDGSCRAHGACPWCSERRKYKHKRRQPMNEFFDGVMTGATDIMQSLTER